MKRFKTSIVKAHVFAALLGGAGVAQAALIDLTGIGFVQYGDGLSYSMPLAQYQTDGNSSPTPGDEFYIDSSPGQIQDLVVLATGAAGGPVNTNFPGMNDAFPMPSGVSGENFFRTGGLNFGGNIYPAPDPGSTAPPPNSDFGDTWDTSLAALAGFLANDDLVFFFNNSQTDVTQAEQSLAAWAQLWVTDDVGNTVDPDAAGPETGYYDFTNDDSPYALISEGGGGTILGDPTTYTNTTGRGGPTGNTDAATDYVLSGGELCVNGLGLLVSCASADVVEGPISHNLGANNAAYAVVFPELNALLGSLFSNAALDLTQYTLHVDMRFGCDPTLFGTDPDDPLCDGGAWGKNLNGDYEQFFMGTLITPGGPGPGPSVPAPGALALFVAGLLGLGAARRCRA